MKRRDALKTMAGLAGAAGLSRVLPACGDDSGSSGITTYVFMMMENRSYDHLFGARSMFEGKPGNGPSKDVTLLDSADQPVGLRRPDKDNLCDLDPPHGWESLRDSWNNGACDQFVKVHQRDHAASTSIHPMLYLTRNEAPISYALADAYTSCDNWFSSVMGPTWPNRFYWHTGESFGQKVNTLPESMSTSVYHQLVKQGIDWGYYYGNIPVLIALQEIEKRGPLRRFSPRFFEDAAAGTLPPVTYIDPAFGENDDHPPLHPILGQALLASVYKALAASPQWPNILFVLTYDESGGFYDHVSPPQAPDQRAADGFNQLGFRVPTLVMGPYAKQGYVSSVQYDHTSALRHLENQLGLPALTMRDAAAADLMDCIDTARLAARDWAPPVELPEINLDDWPMGAACNYNAVVRDHPILEWADAHPELLRGYDLRSERAEYHKAIASFLREPPRALTKR